MGKLEFGRKGPEGLKGETDEKIMEGFIAQIDKLGDVATEIGNWFSSLFEKLENWFSETIDEIKNMDLSLKAITETISFNYKLMNGSLFIEKTL